MTTQSPDQSSSQSQAGRTFFSYDPEDGIRFHDTAEQAQRRASLGLDQAEFNAADSDWHWQDNEHEICWGVVYGQVEWNDRELTEDEKKEHPDWKCIREIKLIDYQSLSQSPAPSKEMEECIDKTWEALILYIQRKVHNKTGTHHQFRMDIRSFLQDLAAELGKEREADKKAHDDLTDRYGRTHDLWIAAEERWKQVQQTLIRVQEEYSIKEESMDAEIQMLKREKDEWATNSTKLVEERDQLKRELAEAQKQYADDIAANEQQTQRLLNDIENLRSEILELRARP